MRGIEPLASRMRIERSTTELHPHTMVVVLLFSRATIMRARLAEWSKAWDLSSHNRKIAWVRTPHLAWVPFANRLQWRNRLARGTYTVVHVRNAEVVSSSLTWNSGFWSKQFYFINRCYPSPTNYCAIWRLFVSNKITSACLYFDEYVSKKLWSSSVTSGQCCEEWRKKNRSLLRGFWNLVR